MRHLALALVFIGSGALAAESKIGFSGGSEYSSVPLNGSITVQCNSGIESRVSHFDCRSEVLFPYEFDYFYGPKMDADEVVLVASREDGSTRKKDGSYDGSAGRSKKHFNLWVSTVFQRPLLNFGKNSINFNLKKNGRSVSTGNFEVNVSAGEPRYCARRYYFSSTMQDCESNWSMCQKYFADENYCQ